MFTISNVRHPGELYSIQLERSTHFCELYPIVSLLHRNREEEPQDR